jgi:NAD(P)-dependent dehydrogenase (short-subunit alcohol dehydrogenase family)
VVATARSLEKVQHLKAIGLIVLRLDVKDAASIRDAATTVGNLFGSSLDILVNNAGIGKCL